jgi:hypothetical protein
MSTLPMNLAGQDATRRRPRNISNARRQARMQKQLGVALLRDGAFDVVVKYALVWLVLIAVVAGFAETYTYASTTSHDKYYLYNLDVPRRLL